MHRFFAPAESISGDEAVLDTSETRHLRDVLRIRPGESVRVFDGIGGEYECRVKEIGKMRTKLEVIRRLEPSAPESPLDLTVAAVLTPPDRFDLVVQKSVELGVKSFLPLVSDRCEIKVKDAAKKIERWRRIALEAAKQCGRATLMNIGPMIEFETLFAGSAGEIILFSERDGAGFDKIEPSGKMTVVYGPKGGWDDRELELAKKAGAQIITFGGRILKAETAAIGLTAIIQHRFGDMN